MRSSIVVALTFVSLALGGCTAFGEESTTQESDIKSDTGKTSPFAEFNSDGIFKKASESAAVKFEDPANAIAKGTDRGFAMRDIGGVIKAPANGAEARDLDGIIAAGTKTALEENLEGMVIGRDDSLTDSVNSDDIAFKARAAK